MKCYVRKEVLRLWAFLKKRGSRVSVVEGAAGTGSSVVVFHYAMWAAKRQKQRVLYLHSTSDSGYSILFKHQTTSDNYLSSHEAYEVKPQYLLDLIVAQMEAGTVDLVVAQMATCLG